VQNNIKLGDFGLAVAGRDAAQRSGAEEVNDLQASQLSAIAGDDSQKNDMSEVVRDLLT